MISEDVLQRVKESFGRALSHGDLMGRFYEIFLKSAPEIAPMFKNTDFDAQKQLLRQGINLALMFAAGSAVGQSGIDRIAKSHNQAHLNIRPDLYHFWKDSYLQAIAEVDPRYSPELKDDWAQCLQVTIDHIIAHYKDV